MASDDQRLEALTQETCAKCLPATENAKAKILKVLDGDTVVVGFFRQETPLKISARINGIDTPEIHSKDLVQKRMAIAAKERLEKVTLGRIATLKHIETEKYGRLLCDLEIEGGPVSIREYMLEDRSLTHEYFGDTKQKWSFTQEQIDATAPLPPSPKHRTVAS
jgi:micrococcal nuclease